MRIIDMHCDTIYLLQNSNEGIRKNSLQIDLHKMKEADYLLQNFALFVNMTDVESPLETGLLMADIFHREMEKNKDLIRPVTTYAEIMKNKEEGLMSALLTLEEGEICKGNPALLRDFYRLSLSFFLEQFFVGFQFRLRHFDFAFFVDAFEGVFADRLQFFTLNGNLFQIFTALERVLSDGFKALTDGNCL